MSTWRRLTPSFSKPRDSYKRCALAFVPKTASSAFLKPRARIHSRIRSISMRPRPTPRHPSRIAIPIPPTWRVFAYVPAWQSADPMASPAASATNKMARTPSKVLRPEFLLGFLRPQALQLEVLPHPLDRIALRPRFDFLFRPVARRIVARGMRTHAIGDRFDHRRAASASGFVRGRLRHSVHGEQIVPVHADAVKAVCQGLLREGFRGGLTGDRDGDRPLVVLTEENRRGLEDAREVHRGMEVALARRAVAEVCQRDDVVLPDLRGPGRAHRLRDLCSHRA